MEFAPHISSSAIFWLAIVAIVFVSCFFTYRTRASRHRMIETLAEKGLPIPPDYLEGGRRDRSPRGGIASGIFLMCIGIALGVFFWAMTGWGNPITDPQGGSFLIFVGIFPFMIGLARILASPFERPGNEK